MWDCGCETERWALALRRLCVAGIHGCRHSAALRYSPCRWRNNIAVKVGTPVRPSAPLVLPAPHTCPVQFEMMTVMIQSPLYLALAACDCRSCMRQHQFTCEAGAHTIRSFFATPRCEFLRSRMAPSHPFRLSNPRPPFPRCWNSCRPHMRAWSSILRYTPGGPTASHTMMPTRWREGVVPA